MAPDDLEQRQTPSNDPGEQRPPGEIGGHTVQPWEQDAVPPTTTPNSKDVPPPELGAREAQPPQPAHEPATASATSSQRLANLPGSEGARPALKAASGQAAPPPQADQVATPQADKAEKADKAEASPGLTRPSRPPVYKPQNGHEPAPRPAPVQLGQARAAGGPATEGDALVAAITRAIAENLAKALHQSIAQAVRDAMPLSGRTLAQPKVDVGPNLVKAPPKAKASKPAPMVPAKPAGLQDLRDLSQEAKPAPKVDPSAQSPLGSPGDQPRASHYGGTIEPADEAAKAKLAQASKPGSPSLGQAAAESADRETRDGNLA